MEHLPEILFASSIVLSRLYFIISSSKDKESSDHIASNKPHTPPYKFSSTPPPPPSTTYLNNPVNKVPISVIPSSPWASIRQIVGQIFPDYNNSDFSHSSGSLSHLADRLLCEPLSGGLSNLLFKVTIPSNNDGDLNIYLLFRVDADSPTEAVALVNKPVECRIFTMLSKAKLAPTFYGQFQNGRVEEFYSDSSPISFSEMGATAAQLQFPNNRLSYAYSIAELMAEMHSLRVPENVCETKQIDPPMVIEQVDKWWDWADDIDVPDGGFDGIDLLKVKRDWLWLKGDILFNNKPRSHNPSVGQKFAHDNVFTHLDCQSLNIMASGRNFGPNHVKFIDFEYAGFNSRALDIANTWLEHCDMNNNKADYKTEFPSLEQQRFFLITYCKSCIDFDARLLDTSHFLEDFRREVLKFTLLSHLNWALWSVIQYDQSEIEFDFLLYAKLRLKMFADMKIGLAYDDII